MKTPTLAEIKKRFGIRGAVEFAEIANGLPVVDVSNRFGKSRIALQGAQLLHWTPDGQAPVVWLSPRAKFVAGKSARGGIPVCWPWFGPHPSEGTFPLHGFARGAMWELIEAAELEGGAHRLAFRFERSEADAGMWPHSASLEVRFTLAAALEVEMVTRNEGAEAFRLSEALHAYFNVGDARTVRVLGLEGVEYLDRVGAPRRIVQAGPVTIEGEVDRIYGGTEAACVIEDSVLKRRIRIEKRGSRSTVVWNPGEAKAASMGDFEEGGYLRMLCVESANAGEDAVTVQPGQAHTLWVRYTAERLG